MILSANDLTSFKWATVKLVSPLAIQLDGDSAPLALIPDTLVDPNSLAVGDRVRVEMSLRKIIIHGKANGGRDNTGWITPVLQNGFYHHPTTPLQYRIRDGRVALRGAVYRSSVTTPAGTYVTVFSLPNIKYAPSGQVRHAGRADAGQSVAVINGGDIVMLITTPVTSGVGLPMDGINWDY